MSAAVTRRAALRGSAAAALGLGIVVVQAAPILSADDQRLVNLAATLASHFDVTEAYAAARTHTDWNPAKDPTWDAAISAYTPWEDEMADLAASSMAGIMAKARAVQVPTTRHCRCGQIPMANGRCRFHGGLSTGPKTAEGIARQRSASTTRGPKSRYTLEFRKRLRELQAETRRMIELT